MSIGVIARRGVRPRADPRRAATDRSMNDLMGFVGAAAVLFSAIYFVSDVIELKPPPARKSNKG
jgi:hypothetical protein